MERGGPREDGTQVGRIQRGAFFFFTANGGGNLSFLCVYEWCGYVRGFLLVLRASFRGGANRRAVVKLWENVGRWEGGGGGKKVWIVSR